MELDVFLKICFLEVIGNDDWLCACQHEGSELGATN